MEKTRAPYKDFSEIGFWQMTTRLIFLAGFLMAASGCLLMILKGIIGLSRSVH